MTRRSTPWLGLMLLCAAFLLLNQGGEAHAQLGMFGDDDEDAGDAGYEDAGFLGKPKKYLSNPWKEDSGPEKDSGPGIKDIFKRFQSGPDGSFLQTRAPTIADIVDSDASMMGDDPDGGKLADKFDVTLPNFGADIDAGTPDAGAVVKPTVRVARPSNHAVPLTSPSVPGVAVWARVPASVEASVHAVLGIMDGGPKVHTYASLSAAQRKALWEAAAKSRGWREGHPAFLLGDVGRPIPAKLVALGMGKDGSGSVYAAFVCPRDGVQVKDPSVVLAGSGNVGAYRVPQPFRPAPNARFNVAVERAVKTMGTPFGMATPVPGKMEMATVRGAHGLRAEILLRDKHRPNLCAELSLDEDGRLLASQPWSPVCVHKALRAVDVDGDGVDEVLWDENGRWVLRREGDGSLLDADPPGER